jgi:hypothetical protein
MAALLKQWSMNEVCAVIHFLNARNVLAGEINCQLVEVYGEDVMSEERVAKMVCTILRWRNQYITAVVL